MISNYQTFVVDLSSNEHTNACGMASSSSERLPYPAYLDRSERTSPIYVPVASPAPWRPVGGYRASRSKNITSTEITTATRFDYT